MEINIKDTTIVHQQHIGQKNFPFLLLDKSTQKICHQSSQLPQAIHISSFFWFWPSRQCHNLATQKVCPGFLHRMVVNSLPPRFPEFPQRFPEFHQRFPEFHYH